MPHSPASTGSGSLLVGCSSSSITWATAGVGRALPSGYCGEACRLVTQRTRQSTSLAQGTTRNCRRATAEDLLATGIGWR
jgi:hypothetical protein